ncbi:hypothetical protein [Rufibacter tibetensis]|uniref:Helix-turn-helix domain-containing protein n=1 Tax=Rufibacter tibetensis TaxID=512763 RepID=A0A0N7HX02_9BACT|nr:hypothetical protein [Rufibacter tibetensis]ALJ00681.1 hypothetical protein DC20_18985 [Rufibacter tibetensis]
MNKNECTLLKLQELQMTISIKKDLWETALINQEEAAFLLGISKETLRDKATEYKQIRNGNKIYYDPKQLKNSLMNPTHRSYLGESDLDSVFNSHL